MTRQIIFRGYNLKNKKWLYGYYFVNRGQHFICPDGIVNPLASWEDFVVEEESVGQFTGMKDKNGKEIWEADIVEAPLLDPIFGDVIFSVSVNSTISFRNGSFVVDYNKRGRKIYLQDLSDKIEVVGNIYENKELLEGEK